MHASDPEGRETAAGIEALALEGFDDGVIVLEGDGRVLYLNQAMETILGRRRDTVLGHDISMVCPEAMRGLMHQALRAGGQSPRLDSHTVSAKTLGAGRKLIVIRSVPASAMASSDEGAPELERDFDTGVAQAGAWRFDAESRRLIWSHENYRIFGVAPGTHISYEVFLATTQASEREAIQRTWQAGPRGAVTETERQIVVEGKPKWVRERARLEFDDEGRLIGGYGTTLDITVRKQAEQALAQQRARFESVVDSAMDSIIAVDADQRIILFNAAAESMFHCPATEALGHPIDKFIPERFHAAHVHHIRGFDASGATCRSMGRLGTLYALKADGCEFPIEASISQSEVGGSKIFTVIIRDITDRLKAEEQQRLLTAELDHRVKNVLANLYGVIRLSSRDARSVREFADNLGERIRAMSVAHDLLQRSRWTGVELQELCETVLKPYRLLSGNIRLEGPRLAVAPNAAQSLALGLHELATNAVKYGALSVPEGRVAVSWWRAPDPQDANSVRFVWREGGGPRVEEPTRKGFGLTILQAMVANEPKAKVTCDFRPEGFIWTLESSLAQPHIDDETTRVSWLSRETSQAPPT